MNITHINQAPEYVATNHFDMTCLRLQGREASPAIQLWMGMLTLQPGGHTSLGDSPLEKHYVVLQGELTFVSELNGLETREVLHTFDSCRFEPDEKRQIINNTDQVARV
jgi:hypothetical protein